MNTNEKYDSLNSKSVWAYTKQKAGFRDVFNSAKLFSEIEDLEHTNVETYFKKNYSEYGISTDRHRIWAIAQMFGFLTKDSYYSKGRSSYSKESITPVFKALKRRTLGDPNFNKIVSEQILKIKVKTIIDTMDYRNDYHIYPFLFLFLVLWKLDKDYNIKKVSYDKVWTYILTCKSMDEVDDAASWVADPSAKISSYLKQYRSDSRFMTLFFECTKMFSLQHDELSLNYPIAENFYNSFILKHDLTKITKYLYDDAKYKKYLENVQGFDFDLTNNETGVIKHSHKKKSPVFKKKSDYDFSKVDDVSVIVPDKETKDVSTIIDSILDMVDEQEVKEAKVYNNDEDIKTANERPPVLKNGLETNNRYSTDPRLAKTAIKKAGYVCELSGKVEGKHTTFNSARGTKYLEAHHLVPMKAQKDYISSGVNLDRMENIVALCPNCHKAVHYGTRDEKVKYLKPLYDTKIVIYT